MNKNILSLYIFIMMLFISIPVFADGSAASPPVNNVGMNTAKEIITDEKVIELFKQTSFLTQLLFIIFTIVVIALIGAMFILFYSLRTNQKTSKEWAKGTKDMDSSINVLTSSISGFKGTVEAIQTDINQDLTDMKSIIENLKSHNERYTQIFSEKIAEHERNVNVKINEGLERIDSMVKTLKSVQVYCDGKNSRRSEGDN
jgi:uncharacterized protein YoxC